jgi:hypothetical protein
MKNELFNHSFSSLGLPTYTYKILRPLERAFAKFASDAILIDTCAELIWLKTLRAHYSYGPNYSLTFALQFQDRHDIFQMIEYLTIRDEIRESRTFWTEKFTPFKLQYGPEPFTINFEPFEAYRNNEYDAYEEIYESSLQRISINEDFEFQLCSFEGLIINRILKLRWDDHPLYAYESLDVLIQLIYSLFHNENSESLDVCQPYNEQIRDLHERQSHESIIYSISGFNHYWIIYYPEFIGRRIKEIIGENDQILRQLEDRLDCSMEDKVISLFDQFDFTFPIGPDEALGIDGKDVKMILRSLKTGLSN